MNDARIAELEELARSLSAERDGLIILLETQDTEGVCELTGILYRRDFTIERLTTALNRIAMLGLSELAYTSEFTERVNAIAREALTVEPKKSFGSKA